MTNEIIFPHDTPGLTSLYAVVLNGIGQIYNGATFEAITDANWGNYDIPLTEGGVASQIYLGTFPVVAAGVYTIFVYDGAAPAVGDTLLGAGKIDWGGTAEKTLSNVDLADDAITAAKIAPDAIGSSEMAASAVTEIQAGLATTAALGVVGVNVAQIVVVLDELGEDDGFGNLRFTAKALEEAPGGGAINLADFFTVDTGQTFLTAVDGSVVKETAVNAEGCCGDDGSVEYTYTVTDSTTGLPVEGVRVRITTDVAGLNVVYAGLITDVFGVARFVTGGLPWLDPGSYYFWKRKPNWSDDQNPDLEVVV